MAANSTLQLFFFPLSLFLSLSQELLFFFFFFVGGLGGGEGGGTILLTTQKMDKGDGGTKRTVNPFTSFSDTEEA